MTLKLLYFILLLSLALAIHPETQAGVIIDHTCTDLTRIPSDYINAVKNSAKMYYAHTSHGEQLVLGLDIIESSNHFYSIA